MVRRRRFRQGRRWGTHGILAAEVEQVVKLVELSRDHKEEESDQQHDRQPGLCVRRANVTISDRAAQGHHKKVRASQTTAIMTKRDSRLM